MCEVVLTNLFLIYAQDSPPESGIFADLLVEISGDGRLNGSFRWSLRSSEPLKTGFNAKGMCSYDNVDGFELSYEVKPGDLPFRHNTSTTSSEDMADLITEGRISVTKDGEEAHQELIGKTTYSQCYFQNQLSNFRNYSPLSKTKSKHQPKVSVVGNETRFEPFRVIKIEMYKKNNISARSFFFRY
jgi:hypothetical protein